MFVADAEQPLCMPQGSDQGRGRRGKGLFSDSAHTPSSLLSTSPNNDNALRIICHSVPCSVIQLPTKVVLQTPPKPAYALPIPLFKKAHLPSFLLTVSITNIGPYACAAGSPLVVEKRYVAGASTRRSLAGAVDGLRSSGEIRSWGGGGREERGGCIEKD